MAVLPRPAGLYLNAEQADALRGWYEQVYHQSEPKCRSNDVRLAAAIAPLMRTWRYERFELGWKLHGPPGQYFVQPDRLAVGDYSETAMAILCDALNRGET